MACHYVFDSIAGKVLIPGCMGTAVYNDRSYCTCKSSQRARDLETRVERLEKQVRELKKMITQNKAI